MTNDSDTSASGIQEGKFEGISPEFTELYLLRESDTNILLRGKRYGRWWLLKGLQPDLSELTHFREMLRKEFELLMKAQHPGIVQVTGLEEVDSFGECIVMEYVEGSTLRDLIKEGMNRRTATHLLDEVLDAVAYIHSIGIVHRDLKPSNIIVTRAGHAKLIDFGLADTDAHAVLKQTAGTTRYMSPEQGSGKTLDTRNDIYSIGIIMRELPLPWAYRRCIGRCLCPIEQRWGSIEEMTESIGAFRAAQRYAAYAVAVAVLLAILAVGVMLLQRSVRKDNGSGAQVQDNTHLVSVDSLETLLQQRDSEIVGLRSNMTRIVNDMQNRNDSLKHVVASMNANTIVEGQRANVVRAWEMRLKRLTEDSRLERTLDTLSRWEAPYSNQVTKCIIDINRTMREHIDELAHTYDENEIAQLKDILLPKLKAWNDRMAEKIRRVKAAQKSSEM